MLCVRVIGVAGRALPTNAINDIVAVMAIAQLVSRVVVGVWPAQGLASQSLVIEVCAGRTLLAFVVDQVVAADAGADPATPLCIDRKSVV